MPSSDTILERLDDCDKYLSQFDPSHQSARFEELICQAFATLLHLPFYDADNDDKSERHKVTWCGGASPLRGAPGGPDGVGRAHNFAMLIEATLKLGTKQWSQEFAQCLDHADKVIKANNMEPKDTYIVFVATKTHQYSYDSAKTYNARNRPKIVLIELDVLRTTVETSLLAFTMKHVEARKLILGLLKCLSDSSDLLNFRDRVRRCLTEWQQEVLQLEKAVVLAVKSYEAMLQESRDCIAISEILMRLQEHPMVKLYFDRAGGKLDPEEIIQSLVQEGLGALEGPIRTTGEEFLSPVPFVDFKSRCQRRLQAVEEAHGRK